jgi:hypothetical protein
VGGGLETAHVEPLSRHSMSIEAVIAISPFIFFFTNCFVMLRVDTPQARGALDCLALRKSNNYKKFIVSARS